MTERPLQRDGFIWEVRRTLDEYYTCCRGEDQERISIKSVCPYITPEVPAASALVTLEELAYLVCIERAPPLDPQFFEYLKVPRWPAGIWVEWGYMSAPDLLVIIHIQRTVCPTVDSSTNVFSNVVQRVCREYLVAFHASISYSPFKKC